MDDRPQYQRWNVRHIVLPNATPDRVGLIAAGNRNVLRQLKPGHGSSRLANQP
jgi:hypothetical protein